MIYLKKSLFLPYFILLVIFKNEKTVSAHTGDNGALLISSEGFIMVNLIILSLSLGLVYLINQFQKNEKLISSKKLILIVVFTLFVNAIVAVNTYVEIK